MQLSGAAQVGVTAAPLLSAKTAALMMANAMKAHTKATSRFIVETPGKSRHLMCNMSSGVLQCLSALGFMAVDTVHLDAVQ